MMPSTRRCVGPTRASTPEAIRRILLRPVAHIACGYWASFIPSGRSNSPWRSKAHPIPVVLVRDTGPRVPVLHGHRHAHPSTKATIFVTISLFLKMRKSLSRRQLPSSRPFRSTWIGSDPSRNWRSQVNTRLLTRGRRLRTLETGGGGGLRSRDSRERASGASAPGGREAHGGRPRSSSHGCSRSTAKAV